MISVRELLRVPELRLELLAGAENISAELTCGTFGNVLRFLPPLVIDEALLLLQGLSIVETALAEAGAE